jgi:hypothetical protein
MLAGASQQVGGDIIKGVNFSTAATEELQYQLYNVPRVSGDRRGPGNMGHETELICTSW